MNNNNNSMNINRGIAISAFLIFTYGCIHTGHTTWATFAFIIACGMGLSLVDND